MTGGGGILDSRPLTFKTVNNPTSFQPLPINLLTIKSKSVSPPPGKYLKPDVYY